MRGRNGDPIHKKVTAIDVFTFGVGDGGGDMALLIMV